MSSGRLRLNLAGLELENPTFLASGVLGYSTESMQSIVHGGAGAVVTKSIGLVSRVGYTNPTVFQAKCGLVNAMGLPNPGIDQFASEIRYAKTVLLVPVVASVYGYSGEEYASVAQKAAEAGADAVELNVSCPHVSETGCEIGQNPEILRDVILAVKCVVHRPVFVKLSSNVTDMVAIALAAAEAGADALVIMNTLKAMVIDVETAFPVLGNKRGGLSGPAIKPVALRCVYDVYEQVKKPIIGCGGITSWRDAVEFFLAGASAVQIGTAVATKGPRVFRIVNRGVDAYLKRKMFRSVTEIVGLSHRC